MSAEVTFQLQLLFYKCNPARDRCSGLFFKKTSDPKCKSFPQENYHQKVSSVSLKISQNILSFSGVLVGEIFFIYLYLSLFLMNTTTRIIYTREYAGSKRKVYGVGPLAPEI